MTWTDLSYFRRTEFRYPDRMYEPFLTWLNAVRERAGVPFYVTSDFREHVPPGGFIDSLHKRGRAIDFRWTVHTAEDRARIMQAVGLTGHACSQCGHVEIPTPEGGFELGLEPGSPGGPHWHLGLFPAGQESRLFVK